MTSSEFAPRAALAAIVLVAVSAAVLLVIGPSLASIGVIALVLSPFAVYVVLRWPLASIFGLYVLLVPFDNLLNTGSFGTLTKLLGMISGAFLLLYVVRRRLVSFQDPTLRVLGLLALWMLASTFWALDQKVALSSTATFAGLMLLYAVLTMLPLSRVQLNMLLVLIVAGGVCAAAYGAHTFVHDSSFAQESLNTRRLIVQVGDYQIDPNHFSDALIFPAAIVAMWGLRARSVLPGLASVGALALLVTAILYSGSREGLSALAIIAVYYFWRSQYRLKLAIALGAVIALVSTVQTSVFLRFATALDTGGSGRTSIWAVALEAAKHHLLQGYGIGNFTQAFNLYYLKIHQPYPYGWDSPAHNLVLHYLVELGIVGLLLIGAFIFMQFRSLRAIDRQNEYHDYRIVLEASLIAIVVVSMAIDLFQYKYAWLVFAMVALVRNAALGAPAHQSAEPLKSAPQPSSNGVILSASAASSRRTKYVVSPERA
jgi:O-antigen ligase